MSTTPIPAPYGRRVAAYLIDGLVINAIMTVPGIVYWLVVLAAVEDEDAGLIVLAWVILMVASLAVGFTFGALKGSVRGTPGMRSMKTRNVDVRTLQPIGKGRGILRYLVWSITAPYLGFVSPFFDGAGQLRGWHDKAVKSMVVDVRQGVPGVETDPAPPPRATAPVERVTRVTVPGVSAPTAPAEQAPLSAPDAAALSEGDGARVESVETPSASTPAPSPEPATGGSVIDSVPGFSPPPADEPASGAQPQPSAVPAAPPTPAAPPAPATPPVAPAADDDEDLDSTRIASPVAPSRAVILTWDDGTVTRVTSVAVFGRNPSAEQTPGADAVAVHDSTRSLSKTHFECHRDATGAYVVDRQSTNGTEVHREGGTVLPAPAGQRIPLATGDTLAFGERTCRVEVVE